jgi:hypothetical protein
MKSAYLPDQSRADSVMLLKLLIHDCHRNPKNPFNQVSLIALSCLGNTYPLNPSESPIVPSLSLTAASLEDLTHFDPLTLNKLSFL